MPTAGKYEGIARGRQPDAQEQPESPHLLDESMPALQPLEPTPEVIGHPARVVENPLALEGAAHLERGRRHNGRAAEGRRVRARPEGCGDRRARQHRTHRKTVGERLGQGHDVGCGPELFVGEHRPGTAHPGLNLIEDEQEAGLVAQGPDLLEEVRPRATHPPLPLNRLEHDGCGRWAYLRLQGGDVVKRRKIEPLQERVEADLDLLLAGGREGRHGTAVEGLLHADDAEAVGLPGCFEVFARELDGGFVRLGSTVAEEDPVGEAVRREPCRQFHLGNRVEQVGDMPEHAGLAAEGLGHLRVGVPQVADRDAGHEIGVGLAGFVPEGAAAALGQNDREPFVGAGDDFVGPVDAGRAHGVSFRVPGPGGASISGGGPCRRSPSADPC